MRAANSRVGASPTSHQLMSSTDIDAKSVARLAPTHDFSAKLRQPALLGRVVDYVDWQRRVRAAKAKGQAVPEMPEWSPLSINLDLTTACNYRCDHCIDWDILNSPIKYDFAKLKASLTDMVDRGLRSVILIGGGEPTLHPGFEETVHHLKDLGTQVSIVSNGSRNYRIFDIIDRLDSHDWVRLSLDSGTNETFERMHKPTKAISLDEICEWVPRIRKRNPEPLVGFSFIIVWDGAEREEGVDVVPNIDEIVSAAKRARDYGFNYISLKPFLSRRPDGSEVMDAAAVANLDHTVARIRAAVDEAKKLETDTFSVTESINLRVLEQGNWKDFTKQPSMCHMQALRQVLTPLGLYNCPAHRGVDRALIGPKAAWADADARGDTARSTAAMLEGFDASKECSEVTCLYHGVNWWLEDVIRERAELSEADAIDERFDYFL